jgi:hypothetical protein
MPSFFEGLKRMLSGQPVYRPGEDVDGVSHKDDQQYQPGASSQPVQGNPSQQPVSAQNAQTTTVSTPTQIDPRSVVAVIERVENRASGQNLEVTITAQNNSQIPITLDKVLMFGQSRELDWALNPGIEKEFVNVYNGPRPTNRNYTNCELHYYFRDANGQNNYLSAIHNIEFQQEADGTYTIRNIRFIPPVKDI